MLPGFSVLDDMFSEPFFKKGEQHIMKTDIKETKDKYILEIDLPGYKKEDIKLELNKGYLKVSAHTSKKNEEKNEEENYIHKERFYGKCSRSYYVGDTLTDEDINASFKNGILYIEFKKEDKLPKNEKKYIEIKD